MTFWKRLRNIIASNINFDDDIEINSYNFKSDENEYFQSETPIQQGNNTEREYYAILELNYGAKFDDIKKSYKKLLKKYHPDLYHNNPRKFQIAQKLTEKINEAYNYFEQKYD